MLRQLYIKNFTLIDELDICFQPGFSVITGETGAGKSIILGALGLLLGNRADAKNVKVGREKCVVEAHFDIAHFDLESFFKENDLDNDDPSDCILRREVNASGKSRAFINDQPVTLAAMREIGESLIDIHSQHQNLLLGKEDFQLGVLDMMANNADLLDLYGKSYGAYQEARQALARMKADLEQAQANEDFLRFQFNELDDAHLTEGEQDELEQESDTLEHVEDIKSSLYEADRLFNGDEQNVVQSLRMAASQLHSIEQVYPDISELVQRMDSSYIELQDMASDISAKLEHIDFDPQRLEQVNARLDLLYTLERKYRVDTVEELVAQRELLRQQLGSIDHGSEQLAEQEALVESRSQECLALANRLHAARTEAASLVEKELQERLVPLGIPHVVFHVRLDEKPLSADGIDKVAFFFSANKNNPPQPIADVASGGEIARVMLSLKAIVGGSKQQPTIIFDEIDTGVSGRIAEKMGEIMQEMGAHERQVISITHLPQIAAHGASHYKVSKEETAQGTTSTMRLLTNEERIAEIAQMLSGSSISQAAIDNAKTLLGGNILR